MRLSMDSEVVEEEAVRWLVRRESDVWTAADQAQLDVWLSQHTAHRVAYIRLEAGWRRVGCLSALGAGGPRGSIPPRGIGNLSQSLAARRPETLPPSPKPVRRESRTQRMMYALAVMLAGIVVGYYCLVEGLFNGTSYETPVGSINTVALSDGSHVTLNTNTKIRVVMTPHERRILLMRGEAFFEVAKDKSKPFVVYAGAEHVVAVGTKFSVRQRNDGIDVVVTEGRVNLAVDTSAPGETSSQSGEEASVPPLTSLTAGVIARTSKSNVIVHAHAQAEAENLLSWRKGYLVFEDTALADAVAEFNRYYSRKIVIRDPSIASIRIAGNFRAGNAEAFLWLLKNGFPIEIEERDDQVILSKR